MGTSIRRNVCASLSSAVMRSGNLKRIVSYLPLTAPYLPVAAAPELVRCTTALSLSKASVMCEPSDGKDRYRAPTEVRPQGNLACKSAVNGLPSIEILGRSHNWCSLTHDGGPPGARTRI
ncbi:hypothetical protein HRR77_004833 [Exophiala dermatitidis]|nr:hypothetical protein HRR77_004833 [Exophiala dermatitidis]KAJ4580727.1 hypothetical protein HRR82_004390 [Exophiala dermatitidis]